MANNPFDQFVGQPPAAVAANPFDQFVGQPPVAAAANPFDQFVGQPQGRGIWQALKDYPEHFVKTLLETPQRAIEASETMRTTGELSPESAGDIMGGAMLGGVKMGRTVGKGGAVTPEERARAFPEAPPTEWKPVAQEPAVETIRSAAVRHGGTTYEGVLHSDAYQTAADATGGTFGQIIGKTKPEDVGFVTNTGRYVTRNEAAKIIGYEGKSELASENFPDGYLKSPEQNANKLKIGALETALAHPEPTPQQMNAAQSAAKVVKNILIPDEVSPMAESAAADIRSAGGRAARDTETTRAALDAESRKVAALSDPEKLGLIDYIENRSKPDAPEIRPDLKPVADAVREAMEKRVQKLQELPSTDKMDFVEDYFPHMWQDPAKATAFVREFSSGTVKQGSGASLKKRTIPTIADGIEAGLKPITTDPLEASMRYVQSMDRFIATQEVLDKAKADGNVKYIKPRGMGASGNPDSFQVPEGWVPINGRGSTNAQGWKAYAPTDWARVHNNFIDAGIHRNADWGKIYDAARNTSNAITSLELGLSGFHAATMAQEAMVNSVARAIGNLASGKPLSALKDIARAPVSPVLDTLRGRKLEQTYLNKSRGTPLMQEITNLLTEAGGRAKGARHAPDYQYTQAGSYWDSFKRGSVLAEIKSAGADIKARPVTAPIRLLGQQVGRVMQTVAKPLFEYTIPKMKNGAFYENMAAWMEANPTADHAMQVKAARKIWNSIDNRFGEVVQDNIFWNKTLKQSLQVALRSYSWTFGTLQEIGGGAKDLLRHPSSLSPKSQHYSPKAAYVIALPIVYATLNAVYQKLKTGENPESIQDVMRGGLSGGLAPGVGGRGEVLERTMMPGYMKDVFGWYHHPVQELSNKIATGPRMVKESITNKDWKDQPIRNPSDPYPDQVRQYFKYVYQSLGPISVKQLLKGNKEGSNISTGETLLGLRPTPSFLQDPEGYDRMMHGLSQRDWQKKERFDKKQERQYGGPQ